MATFAIGDLQGCFHTLETLLTKIGFSRSRDQLWFVGDLVNRGQGSLECLRFIKGLANRAVAILGNHDLHLLALAEGFGRAGRNDTLTPILNAPDCDELMQWLRQRPLMHTKDEFVMVHAGLLPQWDLEFAMKLAHEVEAALRGKNYRALLGIMYGNEPDLWRDDLAGPDRYRIIINAMTRMRAVTNDARIDLEFMGELVNLPEGLAPWFERKHSSLADKTVIAGHWSALGLHVTSHFICIDTGCIWGRKLTAMRLEDRKVFQVPCAEPTIPKGWD